MQLSALDAPQDIRYCQTPDGFTIAYSRIGNGTPIVRTGQWFTHLEQDIEGGAFRHLFEGLIEYHSIIRFDIRGTGLSRQPLESLKFTDFLVDLETVVDHLKLERFILLGISQGVATSIAYAAKHPERVEKLVFIGGYLKGIGKRSDHDAGLEAVEAYRRIIRQGWGNDEPSVRQMFTTQFRPKATIEEQEHLTSIMRASASAEVAEKVFLANSMVDVTDLAEKVAAPTLIFHARGDRRVPIEMARDMAARLRNGRLVTLETDNHVFLPGEKAEAVFFSEVAQFLGDPKPRLHLTRKNLPGKVEEFVAAVEKSAAYKSLAIIGVVLTLVSFALFLIG